MSEDDDDPAHESAVALRAKAEHCVQLAKIMRPATRARLIQIATDYLEQAAALEERERNK
jgi:hypothetical protein